MTIGKRKRAARLVTAVAVAGVAAAGVLTGAGSADAGPLPGAFKSKNVPGGKVTIRLFNESYSVQNSVANNPFSREVFVSGKVKVTTGGGIEGGTVTTGYLIGCQLDFGARSEGGIDITNDKPDIAIGDSGFGASPGVKGAFKLAPGEAKFVPVIRASVGGSAVESFDFTGKTGGVAYSQERFSVDGCAGFAQARALVNVQVSTSGAKSNVTLYGAPFSIG